MASAAEDTSLAANVEAPRRTPGRASGRSRTPNLAAAFALSREALSEVSSRVYIFGILMLIAISILTYESNGSVKAAIITFYVLPVLEIYRVEDSNLYKLRIKLLLEEVIEKELRCFKRRQIFLLIILSVAVWMWPTLIVLFGCVYEMFVPLFFALILQYCLINFYIGLAKETKQLKEKMASQERAATTEP